MNAPASKGKISTLEFIATFLVLFFVVNWGLKYFFPAQFGGTQVEEKKVELSMQYKDVRDGTSPVAYVTNRTAKDIVLAPRCPQPQVDVAYVNQDSSGTGEKLDDLMANETALPCADPTVVPANGKLTVDLTPWKYSLFSKLGTYELGFSVPEGYLADGKAERITTRFTLTEPSAVAKLFRTFISKPLFNGLIFIASYMPGHNLGLAVILLTILVKLILLIPSQHALKSQKKMQMLQPRLDELKKKYGDDSKRMQEETMKLWKEMKINPLESCLPMLLQFPILIGLFYVIRDGAQIEVARHMLYEPYQHLSWTLGHTLFGIELLKPNLFLLPPLLVVLQFIQVKMMMARTKKKDAVVDVGAKKSWMPELNQQTMMLYILPLMIGFFALSFPAAVSLYWGVSTLFAIGQQWIVMREKK